MIKTTRDELWHKYRNEVIENHKLKNYNLELYSDLRKLEKEFVKLRNYMETLEKRLNIEFRDEEYFLEEKE